MLISQFWQGYHDVWASPDGSESKESACNAGDTGDMGSIPGLGRSPGGGPGTPLQCSWPGKSHRAWRAAVQTGHDGVTNTNQDMLGVKIRGAEVKRRRRQWHPTPVLLPGESHGWRSLVGCSPWGLAKSWAQLSDFPFTFHFPALEKEMAAHSSVLAWRIPGTEEPGGLPSMGSHRVGHYWSDLAAAAGKESI